jgi:hemoglobin
MDSIDQLHTTLGEPTLRALVAAFYQRVRTDDLIGPMYPDNDWSGAEQRLGDFFVYRFGGPTTYLETRGHPRLRGRHMPFTIGERERDRWLSLMDSAMTDCAIPAIARTTLTAFFSQVADAMRNVPG